MMMKYKDNEMEKDLTKELDTLTAFFTESPDMLCMVRDGRFTRVNPAWEYTLGYRVDELAGEPFEKFIHPDDIKKTSAEYGRLLNGQVTVNFENRYRCNDGSYKRIQWTATPRRSANKEIDEIEVHAAGRDVTEHQRSIEDLKHFFEKSLDMLCFVNKKGIFQQVNPAWTDTLGFKSSQLIGKHVKDFIHPNDLEATKAEFRRLVLDGQNVIFFENRYRCNDGSYKRIQWTATPNDNADMIYAVGRKVAPQPSAYLLTQDTEKQ